MWKLQRTSCYRNQMKILWFLVLCLIQSSVSVVRNITFDQMKEAVIKFKIIPDVIKTMPPHPIEISFLRDLMPYFGNRLVAHELEYAPYRVKWPCEFRSYYTLIMIDPDVPSAANPAQREHLQWLVVNIKAIFIVTAEDIAQYLTPDPQQGTGMHRCVFLIYKQPNGKMKFNETDYNDPKNFDSRYHFSAEKFAEKYNFGKPHAINFFITRWKFVPTTKEPWEWGKDVDQEDGPWDGA